MAGEPDVTEKVKKGYKACGRTYKNHIDGFNLLPYLTGQTKESPRKLFIYISDDGDILACRYDNFKFTFMEQRCPGTLQVWAEPFTRLRIPKIYNLRTDPYEFADITSNRYWDWYLYHAYMIMAAQKIVGAWAQTFRDFPPIQSPNSFTIDQAIATMAKAASHD
jgi:arylsulfatase